MKPVKSSSKVQKKSLQPKTLRLILPKKLEIKLTPFEEWDRDEQHTLVDEYRYNFVTRKVEITYFENLRTILRQIYTKKRNRYDYHTVPVYEADPVYKEKIVEMTLTTSGTRKEELIFANLLKQVSEISSVDISYCLTNFYTEELNVGIPFCIPKEDESFIKTVIELYNDNYNDRIANLKAAFEQRKLQQVQSNSVSGSVPKAHKGNKSKTASGTRKSKKSTGIGFTAIVTAAAK